VCVRYSIREHHAGCKQVTRASASKSPRAKLCVSVVLRAKLKINLLRRHTRRRQTTADCCKQWWYDVPASGWHALEPCCAPLPATAEVPHSYIVCKTNAYLMNAHHHHLSSEGYSHADFKLQLERELLVRAQQGGLGSEEEGGVRTRSSGGSVSRGAREERHVHASHLPRAHAEA
jgi:hypothetical protein